MSEALSGFSSKSQHPVDDVYAAAQEGLAPVIPLFPDLPPNFDNYSDAEIGDIASMLPGYTGEILSQDTDSLRISYNYYSSPANESYTSPRPLNPDYTSSANRAAHFAVTMLRYQDLQ